MAKVIRLLIVDDCRLLRESLFVLLNARPGLRVVATAAEMAEGLRKLSDGRAEIVLVDAALAGADHGRCVRQIRTTAAAPCVIMMNLAPAAEDIVDFAKAGARGFLMKDAAIEDLVDTVRSVAAGANVIPPTLAAMLLSRMAEDAATGELPDGADAAPLTTREREIMELIAEGLGNKAIAHRLGIADDTVKSHVRNMLDKLALHSRLEIAAHSHATRPHTTVGVSRR